MSLSISWQTVCPTLENYRRKKELMQVPENLREDRKIVQKKSMCWKTWRGERSFDMTYWVFFFFNRG